MHRYLTRTLQLMCKTCGETNVNRLVQHDDSSPVLCAPCYLAVAHHKPACVVCGKPADVKEPNMCAECFAAHLAAAYPHLAADALLELLRVQS
jgi:uncharacterized paraquat-inducible protein A